MINPYFTFTTDNKNLCCYKTSSIIYVSFYTDPNEKYKMQIQVTGDTDETIAVYSFQDKKYWDVAQEKWMDLMRAARNEAANNTSMRYYGSYGDVDPW
jgi:hypothetical protein